MATAFFDRQHAAVQTAYARGLGGPANAFQDGQVLVVERPDAHWGYLVSAVTFAMGTLVSVAPELLELARSSAPAAYRDAVGGEYLEGLRSEAVRLGRPNARVFAGDILWALSVAPEEPQLPAGLRFANVSLQELNAELALGRFENGAGTPGPASGRESRNRYGVSIIDGAGEIVALAGVFDTYGLSEIGVDVVEARQGSGLGKAVVSAAILEILRRDETPLYGCSRTNLRSQRTALSTGFLPVCAEGAIS